MYLTNNEIKQLKKELMFATNQRITAYSTFHSSKNSSSEIAQLVDQKVKNTINSILGKIFENNVRKTMEVEYEWEKSNFPRHFFYREVLYNGCTFFLTPFSYLQKNGISIQMNPDNKNCYFKNERYNKIIKEIKEKKYDVIVILSLIIS